MYVTLNISLKFDSLDKIRIISSFSKVQLVRSGKSLINSLGISSKTRPKKYKKERCDIGNVSKKNLPKLIRKFEKSPYDIYEKKRPKHETTESYLYLAR